MTEISWKEFERVDIRCGQIVEVEDFPDERSPAYRLRVDLGAKLGIKKSCAQLCNYSKEALIGKQVLCVVNFPPKQIATAISEVLVLGLPSEGRGTALLTADFEVPLGVRVF
jgi:tRNA-binding protein